MLEALSREISSGCSEQLLCADELALVIEILAGLKGKLEAWKGALSQKR